jgi:phage shock protein C
MSAPMKRLQRSRRDSQIFGVCGGLGDYLETDPTIVRLAWVVITLFTGLLPGVLAYLLAALIVPLEPYVTQPGEAHQANPVTPQPGAEQG